MPILGTIASSKYTVVPPSNPTYDYINSYTANNGDTTVSFTSIPQTYTDLVLKVCARDTANARVHNIALKFNSNSASYNGTYAYQDGTTAGAGVAGRNDFAQGTYAAGNTARSSSFSICEIYIHNYASSNYKNIIFQNYLPGDSNTYGGSSFWSSIWSNTTAVTSLSITEIDGASLSQYSTFYLYGIAKS